MYASIVNLEKFFRDSCLRSIYERMLAYILECFQFHNENVHLYLEKRSCGVLTISGSIKESSLFEILLTGH